MVGAMLFAQLALASAACDWLRSSPAQALATQEPDCHEQSAQNANLCLAHCLGGDQSLGIPLLSTFTWSAISPLIVTVPEHAPWRAMASRETLRRSGAPPPRILFQSFLI